MRSRKLLVGLTSLAATSALCAGTAHADRRSGLAGNLLIQDPDDLFPFPQYTLTHRNMIRLDYGGTATDGNGVLTLGDDRLSYGIALHRGDLTSPDSVGFGQELVWLTGVGDVFTDGTGTNAGSFGGPAVTVQRPAGVQQGAPGEVTTAEAGAPRSGHGFNLRVGDLGRVYKPINDVVDIGFLGNLSVNYESLNDDVNDDSATDLGVGLMGGVGPAIHLERAQIAAYAGLLAAFGSTEPDDGADDDETTHLQFAVPTVNLATEVQLLDWMYVRTGAQYSWDLKSDKRENDTADRLGTSTFTWSAGLGVTRSNFYLDGVIQNAFMTQGPSFIGGGTPGFLAMASLTYKFGDVFSGAGVPAKPATLEPPHAPAAVVAPAPAEDEAAPAVDADVTTGTTTTDTSASGAVNGSIGIGE